MEVEQKVVVIAKDMAKVEEEVWKVEVVFRTEDAVEVEEFIANVKGAVFVGKRCGGAEPLMQVMYIVRAFLPKVTSFLFQIE